MYVSVVPSPLGLPRGTRFSVIHFVYMSYGPFEPLSILCSRPAVSRIDQAKAIFEANSLHYPATLRSEDVGIYSTFENLIQRCTFATLIVNTVDG